MPGRPIAAVRTLDIGQWAARMRMGGLRLWGRGMPSPEAAVAHLTAMQAQEHAYARWSVAQRTRGQVQASLVDRAFDDGRILRTHVLRPTWHYVAREDLRWLIGLSGPRVGARNARRYRELGLDTRTLARTNALIGAAVADAPLSRLQVAAVLGSNGVDVAGQRLAYMLMHAELTAVICSGPMRGKQHTYSAFNDRVPRERGPVGDDALSELARRYFTTRGPATVRDLAWWSGLTASDARNALVLANADLSSRVADRRTYWFAETTIPTVVPRVALVQCYDEVIISYRQSRDLLQTPTAAFSVPGHHDGFAHVVLLDGQLLGHWRVVGRRGRPAVETRLVDSPSAAIRRALTDEIQRYLDFVGAPR
jgi:hypothetical protein